MSETTKHLSAGETGNLSRLARARETYKENKFAYLMVLPTVLYLLLLVWFPWMQGLVMSFFNWPLFGPKTFIGLDNYTYLISWEVFRQSLVATLIYGTQTIGHLLLGTIMALIVWKQKRFVGVVSIIFLIPYVIPPLVTGTLFSYLLNPNVGPFFELMTEWGILAKPVYWLSDDFSAIAVVTLVGVWTWAPLVFLLVISALEGIPKQYYEVAEVFGANVWERFRYITFPQIKTTLLIALIIRIIWNLGKVSQPFVMTRGGPGYSTSMLGVLIYRLAWIQTDFGLAFATGVILSVISLVFISLFVYKFEQEEGEVSIA
ncbi:MULTISPECIES: carbohydrate ABC transporter permease [unclassified Haladaptatus]|uniref:carbohydrate ABC transporter permease n=1 Tax=unclassified Haladaptatus TaxID=2622732 RepID=UPI0023E7A16C|nr:MULTISPECIES: sugar ABC transporter permease [unclassified Haladaptatus]